MALRSIRAVYVRGGTSRALVFHRRDLPPGDPPHATAAWDTIFRAALGTPDPHGRQLDGMGGGISSLSKVAVVGPPTRADADVDYTFAQVGVRDSSVSYRGNCGNISSAIGPFVVEEGMVKATGPKMSVRIHNTNTGKIIVSRFSMDGDRAAVDGDYILPGVAGSGAPIRLAFLDPGGATTGKLLPTGRACDRLSLDDLHDVEVSMVDASNPVVFIGAGSLGLQGSESVSELENDPRTLRRLEQLRVKTAVMMGLATAEAAQTVLKNLPLVAIVSTPMRTTGTMVDIVARMISAGQPHRAIPLTGAMCLAVAARLPYSVVHAALRADVDPEGDLCIEHASGTIMVGAKLEKRGDVLVPEEAVVYRTARRLMEGTVYYRSG